MSSFCPVHEFELRRCTAEKCFDQRQELARLGHALSVYWYDRARGVGVQPMFEFALRHRQEKSER